MIYVFCTDVYVSLLGIYGLVIDEVAECILRILLVQNERISQQQEVMIMFSSILNKTA